MSTIPASPAGPAGQDTKVELVGQSNRTRNLKIAAATALAVMALSAVFAGLGFAKVGPFKGIPFAANIALASTAAASAIAALILGVLSHHQKEDNEGANRPGQGSNVNNTDPERSDYEDSDTGLPVEELEA